MKAQDIKASYKHQNIIYAGILLIVFAVGFLIAPKPNYMVHGILLPSQETNMPAIPVQDVKIFRQLPANYIDLGLIRTALHRTSNTSEANQNQVDASVQFARELAAQRGANAIWIKLLRTTDEPPMHSMIMMAKAIHTEASAPKSGK